jgi:hypothetical protein
MNIDDWWKSLRSIILLFILGRIPSIDNLQSKIVNSMNFETIGYRFSLTFENTKMATR